MHCFHEISDVAMLDMTMRGVGIPHKNLHFEDASHQVECDRMVTAVEKKLSTRLGPAEGRWFVSDSIEPFYSIRITVEQTAFFRMCYSGILEELLTLGPDFQICFTVVSLQGGVSDFSSSDREIGMAAVGPYDRAYIGTSLAREAKEQGIGRGNQFPEN